MNGYAVISYLILMKTTPNLAVLYMRTMLDKDEDIWVIYDHVPFNWNNQYLGKDKKVPSPGEYETTPSKYRSNFTHVKNAPKKAIEFPLINTVRDTIIDSERIFELTFYEFSNDLLTNPFFTVPERSKIVFLCHLS